MTGENGSLSLELVLVTPVLVALMVFVVFAGRLGQASADVTHATAQAARAASLQGRPATATASAQQAAAANLTASGVDCARIDVAVDTSRFAPGGTVAVTVTCTVALDDLAGIGPPVDRALSATAIEVVDAFRGGG